MVNKIKAVILLPCVFCRVFQRGVIVAVALQKMDCGDQFSRKDSREKSNLFSVADKKDRAYRANVEWFLKMRK